MKVNEKIKKIREINDLSQEKMAEKLGIATSTYSKIERGKSDIGVKRLEEIAQILNIKAADLLENSNHVVCLISENHSSNYYGTSPEIVAELETHKLKIQHQAEIIEKQNELLEQQKRELSVLNEMITLLKEKNKNSQ